MQKPKKTFVKGDNATVIAKPLRSHKYSIQPKYFGIRDLLRRKINEGVFAEKLPPVREMNETFKVNGKTLRKAITLLAEEGLVYSKHGSGTYISAPVNAPPALIGCLMVTHGHLFEDLSRQIAVNLQRRGFLSALIDTADESFGEVGPLNLNRLLSLRPHGLIVDGGNHGVMKLLKQYEYRDRVRNLVLALHDTEDAPDWADHVVTDAFLGKYLATRHLIETGRDRVLYLESQVPTADVSDSPASTYNRGIEGHRQALREAGLGDQFLMRTEAELYRGDGLHDVLKSNRINAVVAHNDACAQRLMHKLGAAGLSVPGDIAIVGYYDTPWATGTHPQITSVSIMPEDIAAVCADRVTKDRTRGEVIKIKPRLVLRETA